MPCSFQVQRCRQLGLIDRLRVATSWFHLLADPALGVSDLLRCRMVRKAVLQTALARQRAGCCEEPALVLPVREDNLHRYTKGCPASTIEELRSKDCGTIIVGIDDDQNASGAFTNLQGCELRRLLQLPNLDEPASRLPVGSWHIDCRVLGGENLDHPSYQDRESYNLAVPFNDATDDGPVHGSNSLIARFVFPAAFRADPSGTNWSERRSSPAV